jgi:Uma2 family endonuclease
MSLQLNRRRFTVAEYDRMIEVGILEEDDRLELIDGEIVEMSPIGWLHHSCIIQLTRLITTVLGQAAVVSPQGPLTVGERTEVVPDIVLLRTRPDNYRVDPPKHADVLLVVEVGDSSVRIDRQVKGPLYARAGIPDLWLVDLTEGIVTVHRDPTPAGYQSVRIVRRGEQIPFLAFPDYAIKVDEILG